MMSVKRCSSFGVALVVLLGVSSAVALPKVGAEVANARVEDADGRRLELRAMASRPVLIVYEDKGASSQNAVFKRELAQFAAGDRYRQHIGLVAVADVSAYNFWPVKGLVKDAIRDESEKQRTVIYCDWSGSFRQSLGLNKGASNVVLLDATGRVLFARAGTLSPEERQELFGLLRAQVEPQASR